MASNATTWWKVIRDRRITAEQDERGVRRYHDLYELVLRLVEAGKHLGVTQARLAGELAVSQANVGRVAQERDRRSTFVPRS